MNDTRQTIRCEKCNSEWTVEEKISYSITKCPFCGEVISNKKDTYESVSESIQDIISKYGKDILSDSKRLYSLLTDYIPEKEKELKALKMACNENVFCSFAVADKTQLKFEVKKAKKRLQEDCFMSDVWANQVVSWVVIGLGYKEYHSSKLEYEKNNSFEKQDQKEEEKRSQVEQERIRLAEEKHRQLEIKRRESSLGLKFKINKDRKGYTLVGMGTCNEMDIFVGTYNGLPVINIGNRAFHRCYSLRCVMIYDSVTSIGEDAFCNCSALKSITIPNSVTTIGNNAFANCYSLTNVIIPNSVTSIGNNAFDNCSHLTGVTIPDSVITIGSHAFAGCESLVSLKISNSVTTIGRNVFRGCKSLMSVIIPNSVTSISDSVFAGCTNLVSVTIGNNVKSIGNNAFDSCVNLEDITISNSVTTIGNNAFEDCSELTSVIIPNSVTSIGLSVFKNCKSLEYIYGFENMKSSWFSAILENKLYYYSEEKPKKQLFKRYWHYVDGVPTTW